MSVKLKPLWAVGLESDTAISGIDVAFIQTDGVDIYQRKKSFSCIKWSGIPICAGFDLLFSCSRFP